MINLRLLSNGVWCKANVKLISWAGASLFSFDWLHPCIDQNSAINETKSHLWPIVLHKLSEIVCKATSNMDSDTKCVASLVLWTDDVCIPQLTSVPNKSMSNFSVAWYSCVRILSKTEQESCAHHQSPQTKIRQDECGHRIVMYWVIVRREVLVLTKNGQCQWGNVGDAKVVVLPIGWVLVSPNALEDVRCE